MLTIRSLLTGIVIAATILLLAGCGSSDAETDATTSSTPASASSDEAPTTEAAPSSTAQSTTAEPAAETTTTESPPPAELALLDLGPFDVGVATITVAAEHRERPLTVDVWFPLADGTDLPAHQYTFLPGVYYESPVAVTADAERISDGGPFPLVVYSHGSGGLRWIHSDYTETLASHGHVVVAPDHIGNTAFELVADSADPVEEIARNRPADVQAVIDAMVGPSAEVPTPIAERVDGERIAVTGHSFGGFTSYAVVAGYENPTGSVPADPRVDAVITLAPAASEALLDDAALMAVTVPSMVIVGTDDKTTPIDPNVERPWELAPGRPAYRVELLSAEHQTFTDVCEYQDFLPTLEQVPALISDTLDSFAEAGCQPDDMPTERAHALTNTFALRFLAEVFGSGDSLDPTTTTIPDDVTLAVLAS